MSAAIDWAGRSRQPCPICDRGAKDRSCGVTIEHDGSGVAHCFRCGYVETTRGDVRPGLCLAPKTKQQHETLSDYGREMWAACRPLGGEALAYLEARSCVIPPTDGDLRWHPALRHPPSGLSGPALVALVTDAVTCQPMTLHRTWILADGKKAAVEPPRMLLGGHRKTGGVVRLWPETDFGASLGIAEGIETALSLAHEFRPMWACVDAANLAAFPVIAYTRLLMIAADHDDAGIKAAEACAGRWAASGCEVRVVMSELPGADLNDLAMAA